MPRTTDRWQMLKEAGLPYMSRATHPPRAASLSSYAMWVNVQIAEPNGADLFAERSVIEQTIPRKKLPRRVPSVPNIIWITGNAGPVDARAQRCATADTISRAC